MATLSILHLEDNSSDALLIRRLVIKEIPECSIEHVETGEAYMAALKRGSFHIILSDYRMPLYDGDQALKFAREHYPEIPFIMVTGELGEDRAIETLKRGAVDYVLKDNLKRLVPSIRRALKEAEIDARRRYSEQELVRTNEELRLATAELIAQTEELRVQNEQLDAARHMYQDLYEFTPDAYLVTMLNGFIEEVNRSAEELLGSSRNALKQANLTEFITGGTARVKSALRKLSDSKAVARLELPDLTMKRRDAAAEPKGEEFVAHASIQLTLDQAGKPTGLRWLIRDITWQKRSEEKERNLLHRLYAILSNLSTGIILMNDRDKIEFVNEVFRTMFGLREPTDELLKLSGEEMSRRMRASYADPEATMSRIREIIRLGEPVKSEEVRFHDARTYLCDFVPIRLGGRNFGRLWSFVDISERVRAEDALARSNRTMVDRELRMIELKKEVNDLCLAAGQPARYPLEFLHSGTPQESGEQTAAGTNPMLTGRS